MIRKDKGLRKICRNYEMVENYEAAIADETQVWDLHHRRETDENKSMQQLKDEGRYYDVTAEELIFLTHSEHRRIHSENALPDTRKKLSEATAGEKNPFYGKTHTEETRKKISEALKGKIVSEETKKKMSENHADLSCENNPNFGKRWYNNGKEEILSKEQPGEDFVRGRL